MLQIKKRSGDSVSFNPTKILNRIKKAAKGLKVNTDEIFIKVITSVPTEGTISTIELDNLIANVAAPYTGTHYDYSKLAASVSITSYHKSTDVNFYNVMKKLNEEGIVNSELIKKIEEYGIDEVQACIDEEKDFNFDFFAWKTLNTMYLLKNSKGVPVERPQQMYMRIAIWVTNSFEEAKEFYGLLSDQLVSCATPIMLNSGTKSSQLASCVLHYNDGDSRQELLNTFNDVANYSSNAAGIGLCMSNIRSKDSFIQTSGGKAGGLLKYIKIINEGLRFFNQQGKRPGTAAIYIEPWHKDIHDLLDIKKNTGAAELRARDVFTALMIPDNFMRAVDAALNGNGNSDWYLFCPNEIQRAGLPALQDIWGPEYEAVYNQAVELGLGKKVDVKEILLKIIESQIETGVPYILFKDAINKKSNHQNYGTIKQSNLCAEIVQYTDEEITAICTLASQVIKNYVEGKEFNFEKLGYTTGKLVEILNKVININNYVTAKGKKGGLKQRALAIGVQGLADVFYMLGYSFTSDEAKQLNKDIFETIYYYALDASCRLVEEGKYEAYDGFWGSPLSKGQFQFNLWGLKDEELSGRYDWNALRQRIMKSGVANSLVTGQMPVASSAKITSSYEMTEPMDSNLFNRSVLGGEYMIVNKYLINDLEKLNIWSESIKNEIIMNEGSIQNIQFLKYLDPEDKNYNKKVKKIEQMLEMYKTVWEYKQKDLIDLAIGRAPFIDQTQSMNLYFANPTVSKLTSSMFYTWEKGLKTGNYYIRTKAISTGAKHLAIDVTQIDSKKVFQADVTTKPASSPFECDGCSA